MILSRVLYAAGVLFAARAGAETAWPWLGWAFLAVGLIWAAYDLVDVE